MRIKMLTLYATPKFAAQPGKIIDVDAKLGRELVRGRFAVEVKTDPAAAADKAAAKPADTDGAGEDKPADGEAEAPVAKAAPRRRGGKDTAE